MNGHPEREDVGLPLDRNEVLRVDVLERALVDRRREPRLHARDRVGGFDAVEDLACHTGRGAVERLRRGEVEGPVARRPLPLALAQELERRRERLVVDGGLDREDRRAVVLQYLAHPPHALVEVAVVTVHQASRVLQRVGVVVEAQAAVRGDAGRDRLPTAVHGDLVHVRVDHEVGVGDPLVDLDHLALVGLADHRKIVVVLGVVLESMPRGWNASKIRSPSTWRSS